MNDKPKRIEKGQRWRCMDSVNWLVTAVDGDEVSVVSENGALRGLECFGSVKAMLRQGFWRYLDGGPTPTPGEGKGMEALENGRPARCLKCGGEKGGGRGFVCEVCYPTMDDLCNSVREWRALGDAWLAGARDFPRPARPAPAPTEYTGPHLCGLNCYATGCPKGRIAAPKAAPSPAYGRMVGEMRDASGAPLSALELVTSRSKPEPWIPSVDEDHWIPNVGE